MNKRSTIPTPATPDVCTVAVLVEGQAISSEFHLLSLTVNREVNRIPAAILQLEDGDPAKGTFALSDSDTFIPGRKIEIQLGYRSNNTSVFRGLVVKQGIKIRQSGSVLSVECRHEVVKMTNGSKSRYFVDKKDSEIMEELLGLYSLANDVEATIPSLKEVVQYEASDWDFVLCRADANGRVVLVDDDKIRIAKPATAATPVLELAYGSTVLELDAEIDARWQSTGIKASSWSASEQAIVSAEAQEPTATRSGNLSAGDLAGVLAGEPYELRHGGRLDEAELQAWADARLLRERLAKVRGRARFQGFAGILPGKMLRIDGVGARFGGEMYVSGVRHRLAGGNWETDVQFGLSPEIFAETYQLRPLPVAGLLAAVGGLQIGVVTALENDPEGEDRIQIRMPLINASEDGIWARLATLDAGKERGTYFRPEIDDEVVVGFLNDDPRHPVILGMCHSSSKPAPEAATDVNQHKGYVSREKLRLRFDDEKKLIGLETPAGNRLTLSEDAKGITLEDQNGNMITLDDSGIKIESVKDLSLKASKDLTLAGTNAELKANAAFKAEGGSSAELSSPSTSIKGSATTVIKGGVVQIN
ncbi:MAG: type VI secretion system tip protein VgrG [Candidatus Accumulibacter propinquus]|jgi:Rhs element Vgr protein